MSKSSMGITQEQLQECLERVDMKMFIEDPTQALINAGATLKEGTCFQFVDTAEEANRLPENVFPLLRTQRLADGLSDDDLDQVSGGHQGQGEHIKRNGRWYCTFLERYF